MSWLGWKYLVRLRLGATLRALHRLGSAPEQVEIVPAPGGFFANISFGDVDPIISENVATGFASDPDLAVLKSISEFVERLAFKSGKKAGIGACQTDRSDGFAAFPRTWITRAGAREEARTRALHEATERFVWAHWWDSPAIAHSIQDALIYASESSSGTALLSSLPLFSSPRRLIAVTPHVAANDKLVILMLCELKGGGFLSGGACGYANRRKEIVTRASAELFRHALAHSRMIETSRPPEGFYQKRLAHYCSPMGEEEVLRRLASQGTKAVRLPPLGTDADIPHAASDVVLVHRCLYRDQPPFMGGKLERFCI